MTPPAKLCPICRANVFAPTFAPITWDSEEWTRFFVAGRTPMCPQCAALLVVDDLGELRVLTAEEITAFTEDQLDAIEAIQDLIVGTGGEWRVV